MADCETLHVMVDVGTRQQDLRGAGAQLEDPSIVKSCCGTIEDRGRQRWQDPDSTRRLLPAAIRACGKSKGCNSHSTKARGPLLSRTSIRLGVRRSWSWVL